jgi:hypothetical protein
VTKASSRRSFAIGQPAALEAPKLSSDEAQNSRPKFRTGRGQESAEARDARDARDARAKLVSELDSLEQDLVPTRKAVEARPPGALCFRATVG